MSMSIEIGLARAAFPERRRMPPQQAQVARTTSSMPPAAEQEAYSVISPRAAVSKKGAVVDEDEPLIDTTEQLALKSKKTDRAKKKQERKLKKVSVTSETKSFLELPRELLDEVLSYLAPSDVIRLQQLNKATQAYIVDNEESIAKTIIARRYHVLSRSFQCPVPFEQLDARTQCSLLSSEWQDKSKLHRNSYYQIVRLLDPRKVCTCTTCMLAWNNLNIILDLAHFQKNLNEREPIPLVPRGTSPKWHTELQERNAAMVMRAMYSPLCYALILQVHLETIVGTLTRTARVGKKAAHPKRLYHMSPEDVASGTDMFLERSGPPSTTIPYHRDMYYNLEAYVPNRAWSKEKQKWLYARAPHDNDLRWIVSRFEPDRRGSV
ncbi:hypothetical protein CKM354_000161200 [Cercospora kikuchii]|uniref:F-box domain-containing protein n=1 Tax=Cercospora kikuchii TaxID=84275 RepID=A0A9P3FCV5_9PEZI|nr:uncharacterized protein CKM354_000161200 [Cercospora kikuchii]GIZ38189.1 hypothetical protein CKM354_000161200 [Cercospora kikuchii]